MKTKIEYDYVAKAEAVINIETEALQTLKANLNDEFNKACNAIINCNGKVITIGVGKSGHIATKIAATFASTGTPSFFIHPSEALHGDLGMINQQDVVILISNSGQSEEIINLLPSLHNIGTTTISMANDSQSKLALDTDIFLNIAVPKEACPLNLAPTSSTTATLVMGDALAVSVLEAKGFTKNDFAKSHPGGKLGKRLSLKVDNIMRDLNHSPKVNEDATLSEVIVEMSSKGLGMTSIVNDDNKVLGLFTDGDLRRALDQYDNIKAIKIKTLIKNNFKKISKEQLAVEALEIMKKNKINSLVVVDDADILIGSFNMHDLIKSGIV